MGDNARRLAPPKSVAPDHKWELRTGATPTSTGCCGDAKQPALTFSRLSAKLQVIGITSRSNLPTGQRVVRPQIIGACWLKLSYELSKQFANFS